MDQVPFTVVVTPAAQARPEGPAAWAVSGADGWGESPAATTAAVGAGMAEASALAALPQAFALHAAYPNPFATQATLRYDLPQAAAVRLAVYDLLGREVARPVDGEVEAGSHAAVFDGRGLAAGVYVVRMTAGERAFTRRMTLTR